MIYLICQKVHRRDLNIKKKNAIQDARTAVQKTRPLIPKSAKCQIFQNIQDEVKMLDVEVEKKRLCKIPFTPGRGQTGATI